MSGVKLDEGDIVVGQLLPWAIYDANGLLLLKKGAMIASEKQIKMLLARGLYRELASTDKECEKQEIDVLQKRPKVF